MSYVPRGGGELGRLQAFIQRLNAVAGVTYGSSLRPRGVRAARAGTTGETYGTLDAIAWYENNSAWKTHAAAGKQANAWGLYDMIGNVKESVNDWYGPYTSASATNPSGPATGTYRVLRGGSCYDTSLTARAAFRLDYYPSYRIYNFGFRLVRTP